VRYAAFNLAVGIALVASVFIVVGPAAADPYMWCAQFNISGGTNCGFVTYEQCRAAISGMGGICTPNPFYTGPDQAPARRGTH